MLRSRCSLEFMTHTSQLAISSSNAPSTLTIVINELLPRLGLSLLLAFFVYNLFRAVGLFVVRLDRVSLAVQATLHRDYGKATRTQGA